MSGRRILTDAQLTEMAQLRERGWSVDRIAEHFTGRGTRISASAINWQCMRLGADAPKRLRGRSTPPSAAYQRGQHVVRPYSATEDARLLQLRGSGTSVPSIAAELGRRENSIRGRLLTLARNEARAEEAE